MIILALGVNAGQCLLQVLNAFLLYWFVTKWPQMKIISLTKHTSSLIQQSSWQGNNISKQTTVAKSCPGLYLPVSFHLSHWPWPGQNFCPKKIDAWKVSVLCHMYVTLYIAYLSPGQQNFDTKSMSATSSPFQDPIKCWTSLPQSFQKINWKTWESDKSYLCLPHQVKKDFI